MSTSQRTIRIYLQAAKRYWATGLVLILLIIIGVTSANLATPYVASRIFDVLANVPSGGGDVGEAGKYFGWLIGLGVITFSTWRVVGFMNASRQPLVLRNLDQLVFNHLTRQSYSFFTNRFGGALVAQAGRFVRGYETFEDIFFFELLGGSVRLLAAIGILLFLLPEIGLALLVWTVLFISSVIWLTKLKQPMTRRAADSDTKVTARLADVIANILNLKIFARRQAEVGSFGEVADTRRKLRQRSWFYDELIMGYQIFLIIVFELVVVWLAIRLVGSGSASFANVLLAQFYIAKIISDLWSVGRITKRVSAVLGDTAEMTLILGITPEIRDPARPKPLTVSKGDIRFERATFAYAGHPPVFKGFTLHIKPGERVGLVGQSGSGKSTLTKLLLRFADLKSGRVLVDGQDISKVAQDELRSKIAYVPQEPILFHRSLAENIRYGNPRASDEELRDAARLAHAAEFIDALPDGYDTLVGERGIKLSGGEKQRVAIARAMLAKAPILVLDEATSSLDSKSEKLITDALKRLMQNRTTLVIAHRLSTIRNLDRILVMSRGQIVESGSHQQLLAQKGAYAELWRHQSGGFLAE